VAATRGEEAPLLFRRPKAFTALFLWFGVDGTVKDFSSGLFFCKI
jgi:hypothetical protein